MHARWEKSSRRKSCSEGLLLSDVCANELHRAKVSVWWDGLQAQVKNGLRRLQPEPCNDKSRDNESSVVTVQLPGRAPRCEIKDTSPETKLSRLSIGQQGRGKPKPIVETRVAVCETPTGAADSGRRVQPLGQTSPQHR